MKSILASIVLLSSLSVVADVDAQAKRPHNRCEAALKLSDSQKEEIKELKKASAEKLKALFAEIKKAKTAAAAVLAKPEASKEEAVAASDALAAKLAEVAAAKKTEKFALLFDVLTAEQRVKKVECEKKQQNRHARFGQHGRRQGPQGHHRPQVGHAPRRPGAVIVVAPAPRRPVVVARPHAPARPHRHAPAPRTHRGPRHP